MSDDEAAATTFNVNVKDQRFYESPVPEINQLVMVKVTRVADTSAYVSLLEYAGIEGMILLSEVSTRRIRSMLKEIRVGQFCVCVVLRVDATKGYIDLSRRRVNAKERGEYLGRYAKSKMVHSCLRQLCAHHSLSMQELCEKIAWPLYKKFPHAVDAFKQYINDRDPTIFKELEVSEEVKTAMYAIIEKKLTPQALKLKSKIEVTCFEAEGIDAIKAALLAGIDEGKDGMGKIDIKVVAPPHYEVITQTMGKDAGVKAINEALERIETTLKKFGGNFVVNQKPEVLGDFDGEILEDVESDAESDSSDESGAEETMGKFKEAEE